MLILQDLKNAREDLEKQKKALEVEYQELKRQSISVEDVSTFTFTLIAAFVSVATELPPTTVGCTGSISLMKCERTDLLVIPSFKLVFIALQEMTQSQQIEKDMAEAMSEVCILPLLEQGRFHLQLF